LLFNIDANHDATDADRGAVSPRPDRDALPAEPSRGQPPRAMRARRSTVVAVGWSGKQDERRRSTRTDLPWRGDRARAAAVAGV
jgi:hypothetical protein